MQLIGEIQTEYKIGDELYNRLVSTVKYDHNRKQKNFKAFIDELPSKMKVELYAKIYQTMYVNVTFFKQQSRPFMAWVGAVIRPINVQETDAIFKEGEQIIEIYFLSKGLAGFCLPNFGNKVYLEIEQGGHFGHVDLFGQKQMTDPASKKKNQNLRQF